MLWQRFSSRLIKIASASAIVALRSGLGPRYGYSATQLSNLVALPRPQLGVQTAHAGAGGLQSRSGSREHLTRCPVELSG